MNPFHFYFFLHERDESWFWTAQECLVVLISRLFIGWYRYVWLKMPLRGTGRHSWRATFRDCFPLHLKGRLTTEVDHRGWVSSSSVTVATNNVKMLSLLFIYTLGGERVSRNLSDSRSQHEHKRHGSKFFFLMSGNADASATSLKTQHVGQLGCLVLVPETHTNTCNVLTSKLGTYSIFSSAQYFLGSLPASGGTCSLPPPGTGQEKH